LCGGIACLIVIKLTDIQLNEIMAIANEGKKSAQSVYRKTAEQVLTSLGVRRDRGLNATQIQVRRADFGTNVIPRYRKRSALHYMADRILDPMVLLLLAAALFSYLVGEPTDSIIIAAAIFLDFAMSAAQVVRTQRTLARLQDTQSRTVSVLRAGQLRQVPAEQLVVGDIMKVRAGDRISADARLIEVSNLRVQESALTGESRDIQKSTAALTKHTPLGSRSCLIFSGTTVMSGQATAVVFATGTGTEFGKIAQMLKVERPPRTPLRRKLQRTGMMISSVVIGLVAVIMAVDIAQGDTLAHSARTAVTLVVSAVPEDLTLILTVALTVGVVRILRRKGVVRQLSSAETLGAATVICTDKTGTLTQGVMQAQMFDCLQGSTISPGHRPDSPLHRMALTALALTADAQQVSESVEKDGAQYFGSATERTALAFAEGLGYSQAELENSWRGRASIPFDSEWKFRATLHNHPTNASQTLFVTGAPEVLLERSSQALDELDDPVEITAHLRHALSERIRTHARRGHRLLGVATRRNLEQSSLSNSDVSGLLFLGVLIINDPVRPEVAAAVAETQSAGVMVKLITGDHEDTARSVARSVGLNTSEDTLLDGGHVEVMTDEELQGRVLDTVVFSRIEPIDKQRIVRALQYRGHVVAMTGDGVNDAVALNSADIGVAMGSGKDIAKDASDLILLDDSFTTITSAIREGRVIRDNVRKVIAFLLATNVAEVFIFLASLLLGLPLPLVPAQILWINLVTDGTSDLALSVEPEERNVMQRRPEDPSGTILTPLITWHIVFSGLVTTVLAVAGYWYLIRVTDADLVYARTMVFSFVAVASLLSTWSYRSLWESVWSRGIWQNRWLFVSGAFSLGLQLLAIYSPFLQKYFSTVALSVVDWVWIGSAAILAAIVVDFRKQLWPLSEEQLGRGSWTLKHKAKPASV